MDIAGVSMSLCPAINRCHLTVQSARRPRGAAGWLPVQVITEHRGSQSHQRSMTKAEQKSKGEVEGGTGERGSGNVRMKGGEEERHGRIMVVMLLKVSSWLWSG